MSIKIIEKLIFSDSKSNNNYLIIEIGEFTIQSRTFYSIYIIGIIIINENLKYFCDKNI